MDALSATSSPSAATAARGAGPIDPKQRAEERREEQDRVQGDDRVRDQAARSDAGPGVGQKVDIAA